MTDEPPIVQWGAVRKAWKRWQLIVGALAVLIPTAGYIYRIESFFADHAKKFEAVEESATVEGDTNHETHLIARKLGIEK